MRPAAEDRSCSAVCVRVTVGRYAGQLIPRLDRDLDAAQPKTPFTCPSGSARQGPSGASTSERCAGRMSLSNGRTSEAPPCFRTLAVGELSCLRLTVMQTSPMVKLPPFFCWASRVTLLVMDASRFRRLFAPGGKRKPFRVSTVARRRQGPGKNEATEQEARGFMESGADAGREIVTPSSAQGQRRLQTHPDGARHVVCPQRCPVSILCLRQDCPAK